MDWNARQELDRREDEQGPWCRLDGRHRISREGTGDLEKQWVFRFCEGFISCHSTWHDAARAALKWEFERVSRMAA